MRTASNHSVACSMSDTSGAPDYYCIEMRYATPESTTGPVGAPGAVPCQIMWSSSVGGIHSGPSRFTTGTMRRVIGPMGGTLGGNSLTFKEKIVWIVQSG